MKLAKTTIPFAFGLMMSVAGVARAGVVDFTNWTLVEDPADPSFTASATSTQATLFAANGVVPAGTDIGYKSVDGHTPATSTHGYAFDPSSNFTVAIDYEWSFSGSPTGFLSLGFGIGEDQDGTNSAGAVMVTTNGLPFGTFVGGARVNDVDQGIIITLLPSSLTGSLFVSYEAVSGDVTIGASQTPGAAAPAVSGTYTGIQNQWNDDDLLASFFIRSGPFAGWQGNGDGQAMFSNLRVVEGAANPIPEPSSLALMGLALGGLSLGAFRRQQRRRV